MALAILIPMDKRFKYLALAALALTACKPSGNGDMVICDSKYFYLGAQDPYAPIAHLPGTPSAGVHLAELSIDADEDSRSAEVAITIPSAITTYYNTFRPFSCVSLGNDWKRCTGDETEDSRHGPMHHIVDIHGSKIARVYMWEQRPSSHQVYIGEANPNRGPRLAAFFRNPDFPGPWASCPKTDDRTSLRSEDASRLGGAMTELHAPAAGGPAPESVHSGAERSGDGIGSGASVTAGTPSGGAN